MSDRLKDHYFNQRTLARELGVTEKTLQNWRKLGLKCAKPSRGLVIYTRKWLDEFLDSMRERGSGIAKARGEAEDMLKRMKE